MKKNKNKKNNNNDNNTSDVTDLYVLQVRDDINDNNGDNDYYSREHSFDNVHIISVNLLRGPQSILQYNVYVSIFTFTVMACI